MSDSHEELEESLDVRDELLESKEDMRLVDATPFIVRGLGGLSVPSAVLAHSKRQVQAFESVATILNLSGLVSESTSEEDDPPEFTHQRRIATTERRLQRPSLEIESSEDFMERMVEPRKVPQAFAAQSRNFWSGVREFEPYEHPAFRKLQMSLTAEPYTGATDLRIVISFRPSAFASAEGLSILGGMRALIEHNDPSDEDRLHTTYVLDANTEWDRHSNDGGVGSYWVSSDRTETLTTEMRGLNVVFHQRFKGNKPEIDDADQLMQPAETRELLSARLGKHTAILEHRLPKILESFNQFWFENALPRMEFRLEPNKRQGEGDLSETSEEEKRDAFKEIPAEIIDPRQRELYAHMFRSRPDVTFELVGGLDNEKRRVKRMVTRAKHPELYAEVGITPKATVLFVGPPGCGKTMLARAAAHEMDGIFLAARVSDIESMWAGEAEKNVAALFDMVRILSEQHKVTLFIDEFEGLASSRSGQHMMNWERKITTEFLSALNDQFPNCLIMAATNDAEHVDKAVIRSGRFNEIIEISMPDKNGRANIISNWLDYFSKRATRAVFQDIDINLIASVSEGLSGADLETLIENSLSDAVDEAADSGDSIQPITTAAIVQAAQRMKGSNETRSTTYI